ncbi:sugar ABC transporter substrate-binding protein [Paenibacillus thailandensis]|uniref:Sugar ABC transporter substrate-binding protein n=1 Tax=Paenibacillus thailandensis TaxID=393250 RepID=A0ABW5R3E6_9BACL
MRKTVFIALGAIGFVLFYFTFQSTYKVFRADWLPPEAPERAAQYRLVLITQDLETPFWVKVASGAAEEARRSGAAIEVWGSYGNNREDFLKKLEIAIDSKVDGIIVQGLDTDEFKQLTKVKAAFYGIPVITVASDVPMEESSRRTYVGSDQFKAGQMIAEQLVQDMGTAGKVIVLGESSREYYQQQRLEGITAFLKNYPGIRTVYAGTPEARERVIAATRDLMNRLPDVQAFIAVNASIAGAMIHEIGSRSRVEPYYIYSFDDSPDAEALLEEGKLDGMIGQAPEEMGRLSVRLTMQWLRGETVPLDTDGYLTPVRMLRSGETP